MKTILFYFVVVPFLLISCSKKLSENTLEELLGKDSTQIREKMSKELSTKSIDTLNQAIERFKIENKLDEMKSKTLFSIIKDQKDYLIKIQPRKELYDLAVMSLRNALKVPSSARIPRLTLIDSDSLTIGKDSSMSSGEYYQVILTYQAQNMFGVYLDGKYTSRIMRDKDTKKLVEWMNYNI